MDKQTWVDTIFTPFDQGEREQFFLAATGFLFSNFQERLSNGYYMEFGCYKARTMRHCFRHTRHNFNLRYLAFDSFSGLPQINGLDHMEESLFREGEFSMSEDSFLELCNKEGMPSDRIETVVGYYQDSLTPEVRDRLLPRRATIVYLDCDLYESAKPVLEFIVPFLQKGAIIAFDDWNHFFGDPDRGERKAWSEFRERYFQFRFEKFYSTHQLTSFICTAVPDNNVGISK